MYRKVLEKMRQCVQQGRYKATTHADKALDKRDLAPDDVRRAVLNGRIVERQQDNGGEYKYRIQGRTITGSEIIVVANIVQINKKNGR